MSYITHLLLHVTTFSTRALNILIIILNSLSDNSIICVICESGSNDCFSFQSVVFFFLAFFMLCNFLLKVGHAVPGNKNWGEQNFIMQAYVNLDKNWAVFNFALKYKYQRLPVFECVFLSIIRSLVLSYLLTFSSVQFSHSVLSDVLRPHEPQHVRAPCPSPNLDFGVAKISHLE